MPPERVGNYRIIERIGEGGMGAVYRGEHAMLGRPVAIKILLPELSHSSEMVSRFFNEARATAQLRHPGIVDVFDFGYLDGDHSAYIVMELLSGQSLRGRLDDAGKISWTSAIYYTRQIALALAAAHRSGIVHRDLKPDNVFLVRDPETGYDRVKVLDFGIAKLAATTLKGVVKTRAGSVMGTPAYMSPQQCRGAGEVDARADIYSLGCILFEMVCGQPPFVSDAMGDLLLAHMTQPPPAPRRFDATLPAALEATMLKMLAKPENERQQTMEELVAELDALAGETGTRRPTPVPAAEPSRLPTPVPSPGPRLSPTAPTTLGTSASELSIPPARAPAKNRWRLAVFLASGLAVAGFIVALVLTRSDKDTPATVEPAHTAPKVSEPPPAPVKRKPKLAVTQLTDEEIAAQETKPRAKTGSAAAGAREATVEAPKPESEESQSVSALMDASGDSALLLWAIGGNDYLVRNLGPNAEIRIVSKPAGAAVTYDSVVIGKTPLSVSLERGAYTIDVDLQLAGYADRTAVISAATDHTATIELPQLVHLKLVSKPAGADVSANGETIGKTPLEVRVAPSDQPQQFSLKLTGYLEKPIAIVPDHNRTETIVLEREPQPIVHEIDSVPPGVDVVVAGNVVGKTPYRVQFLEEKGKFRDYLLKAPASEPRYKDTAVHVAADKPFKRQVRLTDICAGRAAQVETTTPNLVNPYDPCRVK